MCSDPQARRKPQRSGLGRGAEKGEKENTERTRAWKTLKGTCSPPSLWMVTADENQGDRGNGLGEQAALRPHPVWRLKTWAVPAVRQGVAPSSLTTA